LCDIAARCIADGAPRISAEVIATTTTASTAIEKRVFRGPRSGAGGCEGSKKIPRLRGVRAARGGGNGGDAVGPKSKGGFGPRDDAWSLSVGSVMPGIQRGRLARDRCVARRSKHLSMISSPL
jgi:hypothetical protein